jgi:uncharacterized protein YllA (UPF0747 family)
LKNEVKNFPERFSPNVWYRMLYQESILPNIIYIGGPGECSYWLPAYDLFLFYQINYPQVLLRHSVYFLSERLFSFVQPDIKLFFQKDLQELLQIIVRKKSPDELSFYDIRKKMQDLFTAGEKLVTSINSSQIETYWKATEKEIEKKINHLETKILKEIKKKQKDYIQKIEKTHRILFPNQQPQDREINILEIQSKIEAPILPELLKEPAFEHIIPSDLLFLF